MPDTTLARRQLGRRLRRLRETAGKTLADIEAAGVGGPTKLWRIETGRSSVRTGDVRDLCALYGVDGEELGHLLGLARATKGQGWWEDYTLAFGQFGLYLDLEAAADRLNTYDPELVHGLLQTLQYHHAVTLPQPSTQEAARNAELLTGRKRLVLDRGDPCAVTAIIGEGALARVIGTPEVMATQLDHLLGLVKHAHVNIHVLPWTAGPHEGLIGGAFTMLEFDDPDDPDVVYLESRIDARFLELEPELTAYRATWVRMLGRSVPLEEYTR